MMDDLIILLFDGFNAKGFKVAKQNTFHLCNRIRGAFVKNLFFVLFQNANTCQESLQIGGTNDEEIFNTISYIKCDRRFSPTA